MRASTLPPAPERTKALPFSVASPLSLQPSPASRTVSSCLRCFPSHVAVECVSSTIARSPFRVSAITTVSLPCPRQLSERSIFVSLTLPPMAMKSSPFQRPSPALIVVRLTMRSAVAASAFRVSLSLPSFSRICERSTLPCTVTVSESKPASSFMPVIWPWIKAGLPSFRPTASVATTVIESLPSSPEILTLVSWLPVTTAVSRPRPSSIRAPLRSTPEDMTESSPCLRSMSSLPLGLPRTIVVSSNSVPVTLPLSPVWITVSRPSEAPLPPTRFTTLVKRTSTSRFLASTSVVRANLCPGLVT